MSEPTAIKNLDGYGNPALEWSRVLDALAGSAGPEFTYFLGTSRPDGTPHVAGVGALWRDGVFYLVSGPGARKARDLAVNPRCTIAVRAPGVDLTFEGSATRVADAHVLDEVTAVYRDGGWPVEVDGDGLTAPFNAPSAGPPPWHLYRFDVHAAVGVSTAKPYGATRWTFTERP